MLLLIKLVEKISVKNLKDLSYETLEESVKKVTSCQGSNVSIILNYFKTLINSLNINFSLDSYQKIYDWLLFTASNKEISKNEEMADLNYLLGYIKGKLNQQNYHTFRSDGFSNIVNSFSNDA